MDKVLIICGPTATGKTDFGLHMAHYLSGEIISADSRQIYIGKDLVYGKDIPKGAKLHSSTLKWHDQHLNYYIFDSVPVWLYDLVPPSEPFNVSYWKECAQLIIGDVLSRRRLPIIVGGTGLYIKALTQSLPFIDVPPDPLLRVKLQNSSVKSLFARLRRLNPQKAAALNVSDRQNPRRLLRALELANYSPSQESINKPAYDFFVVGLTAPSSYLYGRIDVRVNSRIKAGAAKEDSQLAADPLKWQHYEHGLARNQLTWFKKQPLIHWFDITRPHWQLAAEKDIMKWYAKDN